MARENAITVLWRDRERIKREEGRTIGAVKEIASWLGLPEIQRMEAFDISNISGFESVGSMVVFEKGKPKRTDYRKFRIKSVTGPDDYASMKEVLTRRFMRAKEESAGFERLPDLLLMDGGKGQVNIAQEVLSELGLSIPVCGMVKDDRHRTRGLYFQNEEIPIDKHSEGFKLITRLQDEAHRFAIEYHKSLRGKAQVKSFLDDIEGIGPARRKALMRNFESAADLKNATLEELLEIPEMNREAAENVYNYFRRG
jgi:excinuclease ABC subunit C